jgi:hypothetical protein
MWPRNGNIAEGMMKDDDAINWVKSLNYGGYTDWRLPSKDELEYFARLGGNRPFEWFSANGFNKVQPHYYWSSSTVVGDWRTGWGIVSMIDGYTYDGSQIGVRFYVWPVRGGRETGGVRSKRTSHKSGGGHQ